jgi:hypothetical protein
MNVGIVVEGLYDYSSYPAIIRRIRNDIGRPQVRECGGKSKLKGRFLQCLKEFQNPAWEIELAIVVRDSDCNPPQPIENQLREILNASRLRPHFPVELFAVPCVLESWLLSDLHAIQNVAAQRGHGGAADLSVQIPNTHAPNDKKLFFRVLGHHSLPATPPVYEEIARIVNLDMIGQRCKYFREFVRRIRNIK